MVAPERVPSVLLTGTVGAGKTSVAEEISTLLYEIHAPHVCIDLDWLCQGYPAPPDDPYNEALMFANLAGVWANFRTGNPRYLVLARVLESRKELRRYEKAIPEARMTVVRLVASEATIEQRLRRREVGSFLPPLWTRSKELTGILNRAAAEDFSVSNDGRPLREVALEVIQRLGWPRP